jgi:hypothetical protein
MLQVGFLVDMANLKHLVPLGATPSQPLQSGDNTLHFEVLLGRIFANPGFERSWLGSDPQQDILALVHCRRGSQPRCNSVDQRARASCRRLGFMSQVSSHMKC